MSFIKNVHSLVRIKQTSLKVVASESQQTWRVLARSFAGVSAA